MSQEELAKHLGVTQVAVSQWETGETRPRIDKLLRLACVLDCTVDELLKGD